MTVREVRGNQTVLEAPNGARVTVETADVSPLRRLPGSEEVAPPEPPPAPRVSLKPSGAAVFENLEGQRGIRSEPATFTTLLSLIQCW